MTTVVHVRKNKFTLYIGRAYAEFPESKWHNPFTHLAEGYDRHRALHDYYFEHLLKRPDLLAAIEAGELNDQILGCWCVPKDCHGIILCALANKTPLPDYILDWEGFRKKYYGELTPLQESTDGHP
jgi:hypothetical protein